MKHNVSIIGEISSITEEISAKTNMKSKAEIPEIMSL